MNNSSIGALKEEYGAITNVANRFLDELERQINELLLEQKIPLAAKIERRLKAWPSIEEKLNRKTNRITKISDLNDLIGIRLILLFRRDLERVENLLNNHFTLIDRQDTSKKLTESQFGYASLHFTIMLQEQWLAVPTFKSMKGLKAEIQLRTMAQHIWASASHILQYKQEASVPEQLRRTVHRVSALLETVDLEFDRVITEKEDYRDSINKNDKAETIDVVSLEEIMDSILPPANKADSEEYDWLVSELHDAGKTSREQVKQLLLKYKKSLIKYDQERVKKERDTNYDGCGAPNDIDRVDRGVFYAHTGLVRIALDFEQGLKRPR